MTHKKIVVIGGGTGTFTILTGLKKYNCDLTAIVAMTDDGGSTGILRDELGVLPPGDVRQCLIALSSEDGGLRSLMNYRFPSGALRGHNFGNLLLSALEKLMGNFGSAVMAASRILRVRGHVIPATLTQTTLMARVNGKLVRGQSKIHNTRLFGKLSRMYLSPSARANPRALEAIRRADAIIIGPGDLYSSLVPNLLVEGIPETLKKSRAQKIYVCSLMSRAAHTKNFSVADFTHVIEKYLGTTVDTVLYNATRPPQQLIKRYARKGESLTRFDDLPKRKVVGGNFIDQRPVRLQKGDTIQRSLVRHNPEKLAATIARIVHISHKP